MIVAKTKMVRIPETCKKCSARRIDNQFNVSYCNFTGKECPLEDKRNGNIGYGMPTWCPLMDIDLLED